VTITVCSETTLKPAKLDVNIEQNKNNDCFTLTVNKRHVIGDTRKTLESINKHVRPLSLLITGLLQDIQTYTKRIYVQTTVCIKKYFVCSQRKLHFSYILISW